MVWLNTHAHGHGQDSLLAIEGQQHVSVHFDGDGDVEKVHRANRQQEGVSPAQVAGGPNGIPPVELPVRPVAKAGFLIESAHGFVRLAVAKGANALQLSKGIENLDTLPRRPKHLKIG